VSIDRSVAPDGSPVELYLRLSGEREASWIEPTLSPGASVLDLGCGVGRIGTELVRAGHPVTGVDDSPEMLAHAESRGIEPVLADLMGLDLGCTFDAVLLLSHLINEADPQRRHGFWSAAAGHVDRGGLVVVERHHPDWIRDARPGLSHVQGADIELHDLEHRAGGLRASVTYRIADLSFTQSFDAVALDEAALGAEAAVHGLRFVRWLDDAEELGLLTTT
jgi:SAM-dependent methyltransferase